MPPGREVNGVAADPASPKVALVTGCSSGIGTAFAEALHRRGLRVVATARRAESLVPLATAGMRTLRLDVDDDTSIGAAMAAVRDEFGRIDLLVNNAGFGQFGAMVDLEREDLRRQFETNVIAPLAVVKAALLLLRAAAGLEGRACVANVGSIVGVVTTPFAGAYCASKSAIHAVSDALRMELAPFGIRVVTIQPGGVRSRFGAHGAESVRLPASSLYHPIEAGIRARAEAGQQGAMPADDFVRPVVDALLADRPPAVIRRGTHSFELPLFKKLLPLSMLDAGLSRRFGLDRLSRR